MSSISSYRTRPLPNYGTLMTIEEFTDYVKRGSFIDSDGHGCYATETEVTNIQVNLKDIKYDKADIFPKFSHVMWFNK